MDDELDALITHLCATTGLRRAKIRQLIADVAGFYDESIEQFVTRRHTELKAGGDKNEQIYGQITDELQQRRFAAPELSTRQVRRLIYG